MFLPPLALPVPHCNWASHWAASVGCVHEEWLKEERLRCTFQRRSHTEIRLVSWHKLSRKQRLYFALAWETLLGNLGFRSVWSFVTWKTFMKAPVSVGVEWLNEIAAFCGDGVLSGGKKVKLFSKRGVVQKNSIHQVIECYCACVLHLHMTCYCCHQHGPDVIVWRKPQELLEERWGNRHMQ